MGGLEQRHEKAAGRQGQKLPVGGEIAGRTLFDILTQQARNIKQEADDLTTAHQEALSDISLRLSQEYQKGSNKAELQKLTGKSEINEGQRVFKSKYRDKELELHVNDLFQLNSVEIAGQQINLKNPLNLESFPRLWCNAQTILLFFLKLSPVPLPPNTPLLADGTSRFSFKAGEIEYIAIGGSDFLGVEVFKIDKKLSDEEGRELVALKTEYEALKLRIKRNIIKERRLGHPIFNLDDAIFAPPSLFPKVFQPDLQSLNTILSRVRDLEESAKTVTMTEVRNNEKCVMENLGEDSFRVKFNVHEGVDLLDANHECRVEQLFERGLRMSLRSYASAGVFGEDTELLSNGHIKVTKTYTHDRPDFFGKEWKPGEVEIKEILIYDQDYNPLSSTSYEDGRKTKESHYQSGKCVEVVHFTLDTQRPVYRRIEGSKPHRYTFFGRDGREYRDYNSEHKKDPSLTPDQYISRLATVFDSPAGWEIFSTVFMQYALDSPDQNHPLIPGTKAKHGDYWQTAEETVARTNDRGQALGDCDDFAFLAQAVLAKQGVKARVIEVPGHAICAWIKRRLDGSYDAFSICTYGYDKNGSVFDPKYLPETEKNTGYKTPTEALNSILKKYRERGLGVDQGFDYRVKDGKVVTGSIPKRGQREAKYISVNDLVI